MMHAKQQKLPTPPAFIPFMYEAGWPRRLTVGLKLPSLNRPIAQSASAAQSFAQTCNALQMKHRHAVYPHPDTHHLYLWHSVQATGLKSIVNLVTMQKIAS